MVQQIADRPSTYRSLVDMVRRRVTQSATSPFGHAPYPLQNTSDYLGDEGLLGPGSVSWSVLGAVLIHLGANQLDGDDRYFGTIKPILRQRCFACHGVLKQQAGLRLDAIDFIRQGSDSGAVVVSGRADESLLIERIAAHDESERMPPEGAALTADQIVQIASWINADPTPPDAPVMSTTSPSRTLARANIPSAVV